MKRNLSATYAGPSSQADARIQIDQSFEAELAQAFGLAPSCTVDFYDAVIDAPHRARRARYWALQPRLRAIYALMHCFSERRWERDERI